MKRIALNAILLFFCGIVQSQSIFNPGDAVVTYNSSALLESAANPSQPPANTIAKWVRTPKMAWNTDRYKCYIIGNIPFRLRFPNSYVPGVNDGKKYPVVLFFHGGGEANSDIRDNEFQLFNGGYTFQDKIQYGPQDAFVIFPQSKFVAWDDTYYIPMNLVIDELVKNCKADEDRIIPMGLSIGGYGTLDYATRYPQRAATMIASSPVYAPLINFAPAVHIPLWVANGGRDNNPDPVTFQNFISSYRTTGGNLSWSFFPQQLHTTWDWQWAEEPNFGNVWATAHKANPMVYNNNRFFCPASTVSSRMGITPGFFAYQWDKNGSVIPGATTNEYIATDFGTYRARFKRTATSDWSAWSLAPAVVVPVCPPLSGNGTGLKGSYFNNTDLTAPAVVTRTDSAMNFIWETGNAPAAGLGVDHYSVRWTGKIQSQFSENYTIYTKSDDGIRLWINGTQLINNYVDHLQTEDVTNFIFVAGQKYDIKIEYFNRNGAGTALLKWSSPNTVKQMIPAKQLYPDDAGNPDNSLLCATNTSPVNGTTLPSQTSAALSWSAVANATSYDIYIWTGPTPSASPVTNVSTTSYNATGLNASTIYNWYVVPKNASGSAAGCGTSSKTNFTTAAVSDGGAGTGLQGVYYNGITLTGSPLLTRIDPLIDFAFTYATVLSPAPGIVPTDNYSVRWTGQVKAIYSETYTFYTLSDDGIRLWVNGVQLVNNWVNQGATERSGTINLQAGQKYDIVIEYYENAGEAFTKLSWSGASTPKAVIPTAQLYPAAAVVNEDPTTGTGLKGVYYNGIALAGAPLLTRVDPTINMLLTYSTVLSPAPGIVPNDAFSIRWTGQIKAVYSETYTFYTLADDGIRLWVNGVQLINNWTNQGPTEKSANMNLVAGQRYEIIIEYYESTGGSTAKLSWSSPSTPKAVVPQVNLYPPPPL